MSTANEPDPVSNANEPDPVSNANEPEDVARLRVEVVRGGDPGVEVLAAVAAVLTRPVVVPEVTQESEEEDDGTKRSRWRHAALLEGVVPGRRITSIADLAWRREA